MFRDAGHAECVDAGGVTVAVAVVPVLGPVPGRPHVDGTKTTASLDRERYLTTRIMFSKGMVSKSKYWISEKNKGMSVSICLHFKGIFQSQYSLF